MDVLACKLIEYISLMFKAEWVTNFKSIFIIFISVLDLEDCRARERRARIEMRQKRHKRRFRRRRHSKEIQICRFLQRVFPSDHFVCRQFRFPEKSWKTNWSRSFRLGNIFELRKNREVEESKYTIWRCLVLNFTNFCDVCNVGRSSKTEFFKPPMQFNLYVTIIKTVRKNCL
jgi:hypothetical protein